MESVRIRAKKERVVVVSRDASGYGLTLSGDQPVFVATVRAGGAAERAGVRRYDLIVAVNGQSVVHASHVEVVELIQAHAKVSLTLISGRSGSKALSSSSSFASLASFGSQQHRLSADLGHVGGEGRQVAAVNRRITAPIAPNSDAAQALADEKLHTIQLMVEQEQRHVDHLRQELASDPSPKRRDELEAAAKTLAKLQAQLYPPLSNKQSRRRTSLAEPTRSAPPVPSTNGSTLSPSSLSTPPPLPARNRTPPKTIESVPPRRSSATPPLPPPRPTSSSHSTPTFPTEETNETEKNDKSNETTAKATRNTAPIPVEPARGDGNEASSSLSPEVRHERTRSSPSSLSEAAKGYVGFGRPMGRVSPRYETPPGTPPPPYDDPEGHEVGNDGLVTWPQLCAASSAPTEAIITMDDDDDDDDDDEDGNDEAKKPNSSVVLDRRKSSLAVCDILPTEETPFKNFRDLLCYNAHLSVFINYVMSNSDPAAICFYLVTDNYVSGSLKDMQRWAYEIHSSFLIPEAPLAVANLTQGIINDIDRSLVSDFEDENVMRQLFLKARDVAKKELKEELSDFSEKRTAGLGAIFGPPDNELRACIENRAKELQVIDELLLPILESLSEDLDNALPRNATLASSLATILSKNFNARNTSNAPVLDRCPIFASKERKRDKLLFGLSSSSSAKKLNHVKGHVFELRQYTQLTRCNFSQEIIWGIGPQGYHCYNCGYNVLKRHVLKVEEVCVGPTKNEQHQRSRGKNVFSRILSDRELPGRKASANVSSKDTNMDEILGDSKADCQGDTSARGSPMASLLTSETMSSSETSAPATTEEPLQTSDSPIENDKRRPSSSAASKSASFTMGDAHGKRLMESVMRGKMRDGSGGRDSKSSSKVDRSHSLRDQKQRSSSTRGRRKNSDGHMHRAKSDSLTQSHDTPSSSTSSLNARSSAASRSTSQDALATLPLGNATATSDSDSDSEPSDWRQAISDEHLKALEKRETKRQDVINELFQTERSHVRTLRVLRNLFYLPLLEGNLVDKEFVSRLFPNLDQLLKWHAQCNGIMREKRKQGFPIGQVANILYDMFEGSNGDALIEVGATFTENQRSTIEALKERRHRDSRLNAFLEGVERRPECRRLQLQAILPCEHQRLVKYPLLLDQLAKQSSDVVTEEDSNENCDEDQGNDDCGRKQSEQMILRRLVARTRFILESIDKRVALAENAQKLADIQRHLDTSGLDKFPDSPITHEYRNVDLRQHRLLHDGSLTLKLGDTRRFKTVELHVALLEDCIMLLQKHDDKFVLKFHANANNTSNINNANPEKFLHSPVIKFSNMLVRNVATDKRAFYLLNTTQNGPQIYELIASSTADRSQWFRHITEASNSFRSRESNRKLTRGGGSTASMPAMPSKLSTTPTASIESAGAAAVNDATKGENAKEETKAAARSHSFQDRVQTRSDDSDKKTDLRSKASSDRDLQQVKPVIEPLPLIRPEMVKVTTNKCLKAETVVTNLELLRRKDAEVAQALEEKQRIIAEILRMPNDEDGSAKNMDDNDRNVLLKKDPKEVLLAALAQAKSLSELVNASLDLPTRPSLNEATQSSPSTPTSSKTNWTQVNASKLVKISTRINRHLTTLLTMMDEGQSLALGSHAEKDERKSEERFLDDLHPYEELDLETAPTSTAMTTSKTATTENGNTDFCDGKHDGDNSQAEDIVDSDAIREEERESDDPEAVIPQETLVEVEEEENHAHDTKFVTDEKGEVENDQLISSLTSNEDVEKDHDNSIGAINAEVFGEFSTDIESSQESFKEEGNDPVAVTTEDSDLSSAV